MIKELINIVNFGKTIPLERWSVQDATTKLFEEGGELVEAAQIKVGKLPHKEYKIEHEFEESADTILCTLDILQKLNPNMSAEDILDKLLTWLIKKSNKWQNVQRHLT